MYMLANCQYSTSGWHVLQQFISHRRTTIAVVSLPNRVHSSFILACAFRKPRILDVLIAHPLAQNVDGHQWQARESPTTTGSGASNMTVRDRARPPEFAWATRGSRGVSSNELGDAAFEVPWPQSGEFALESHQTHARLPQASDSAHLPARTAVAKPCVHAG